MKRELLKTIHKKFIPVGAVIAPVWDEILARWGKEKELSINFLPQINDRIYGLKRKQLVVIAARTSIGKSALAIQMALDFAQKNKKVYFFTFEMTIEQCIERIISCECEIDNYDLLTGKIKNRKYDVIGRVNKLKKELNELNLYFIDRIGRNLPEFQEIIEFAPNMRPDVVFIDYANLVEQLANKSTKESIDMYIKGFNDATKQHNFCGIMTAQIGRQTFMNKDGVTEPELHHLKDTGNLEQEADMVFLLHWPEWYRKKDSEEGDVSIEDKQKYIINVVKNRGGRTGRWPNVQFIAEHSKFFQPTISEKKEIDNLSELI